MVAADDNVIITNISCTGGNGGVAGGGCGANVTVELWATTGDAQAPFDQATCGPDNMPRGGGYILPTSASVAADTGVPLVTRSSAADGANSPVLAPCAPYVNDAIQNVSIDAAGSVTTGDGRCIVRAGRSTAPGAPPDGSAGKTTVGPCGGGGASLWAWHPATGAITSGLDGKCLGVLPAAPGAATAYVGVVACTRPGTAWRFLPAAAQPVGAGAGATAGVFVAADTDASLAGVAGAAVAPGAAPSLCLTLVEASFVHDAAMMLQVLDRTTGQPMHLPSPAPSPSAPNPNPDHDHARTRARTTGPGPGPGSLCTFEAVGANRVRATFWLAPTTTVTLITAVLDTFAVHGPRHKGDPSANRSTIDEAVVAGM